VLAYPMGLQDLLDIHFSSPAPPAGGEIVFLFLKEHSLSDGLKRPPDAARRPANQSRLEDTSGFLLQNKHRSVVQ
jgi:hypothetical protein